MHSNAGCGDVRRFSLALWIDVAVFLASLARGETTDYYSVQNGFWEDTSTWTTSLGSVGCPTTGDYAWVMHNVDVQFSHDIASLYAFAAQLTIHTDATLTLSQTTTLHGTTLQGAGTFRNNGWMRMTGDVANVINLLLQNNGRIEMVNPPQVQINGRIQNNPGGQVVVQGNGPVNIQVNGQIENKTGAVVAVQGNGTVTLDGTGVFHNAGAARFTGDVAAVINLWLQNQGSVEFVETPSLQWNGAVQNETGGVIRLFDVANFGGTTPVPPFVNAGMIQVEGNTTMALWRAEFDNPGGQVYVGAGSAVWLSSLTTGTFHQATLQGGGAFRNQGAMMITGAPSSWIDLWLENEGRIELIQTPSLQLTGEILNKTGAAFVVNGPGECNLAGAGTFRNGGQFVVDNCTTTAIVDGRFFANNGTIWLGTTACLNVYGRRETNQNVFAILNTGSVFYVVSGGTTYYDRALFSTGAGAIAMRTGVLMCGHFGGTTPVFNVQGEGFQWEGGTINVHPSYPLVNAGDMKVILGCSTTPPLLQGVVINAGQFRLLGITGTTPPPLQVVGGDFFNCKTGTCIFAGQSPAIAGMGFFRNSGDVVFVSGTTGRIGMTVFHHSGTFAVYNASAQLPNGFVMYDGTVKLNGGDWGGQSFWLMGGTVQADGTMKGNTYHSSGTLSPGQSPGTILAEGFYSQSGTANLLIELGGETPGSGYDQLRVTNYASVGGSLTVELYGGYDPPGGRRFDILTASSVSNAFAVTNLPPLSGDRQWLVLYRTNGVQLRVATSQDTDGDNLADAWEMLHFHDLVTSDGAEDDFDHDGLSDFFEQICDTQPTNNADYLRWKSMRLGPAGVEFTLHTGSNAQYAVESAGEPSDGAPWTPVEQFPGTGADMTRTNAGAGVRSFFRVRASP